MSCLDGFVYNLGITIFMRVTDYDVMIFFKLLLNLLN